MRAPALAAAVLAAALPRAALAVEGGAGIETNFPLDIGAVGEIDVWRLGLRADVGWVPPPYVDVVTSVVDDEVVTTILEQNLKSAMTVGVEARGRPWRALWLGFGFRWFGLQGGFLGCEVLELSTGQTFCLEGGPMGRRTIEIDVASNIYALTFSLGWRFRLGERFALEPRAAFLLAVASSSSADTPGARGTEALDAYLDGIYTTYLKVPFIGIAATYRFGRP